MVLLWVEGTGLGRAMRESGPWTYPLVNLAHILGIATLFGSVLVLDLRLLGLWRRLSLPTIAKAVMPVGMTGFGIAAITGAALLSDKATAYDGNLFFYIKFPAIAVGVVNAATLNLVPAWQQLGTRELTQSEERLLAMFGGISLTAWLTAVSMGRMIAYW